MSRSRSATNAAWRWLTIEIVIMTASGMVHRNNFDRPWRRSALILFARHGKEG
jgi:hypothetical protein